MSNYVNSGKQAARAKAAKAREKYLFAVKLNRFVTKLEVKNVA